LVAATYINVYDAMNADSIVLTSDAQKAVEAWLTAPAKDAESKGGTK
jgi:ribosomal protein L4